MKIRALGISFIFWIFVFGCSTEKKKDENTEKLIKAHKSDILFSDFWFGMSKIQYNDVQQFLKRKNLPSDSCDLHMKDGRSFTAFLSPEFLHDSLIKIKLKFEKYRMSYLAPQTGRIIEFYSCGSAEPVIELYLSKYQNVTKKESEMGLIDYEIIAERKVINIHLDTKEETFDVNDQSLYKVENWAISDDLKKMYKRTPAGWHPVYDYKRTIVNEFYITYSNYDFYFRELDQTAKRLEKSKRKYEQSKVKEQRAKDSLQKSTMDNI